SHHRCSAGQGAGAVRPQDRRACVDALVRRFRLPFGWDVVVRRGSAILPACMGRLDERAQAAAGPRMTGIALSLRNVNKAFGQMQIIRDVNLEIASGERHAIIGPNGAGKTTLFNLMSGRFRLSSGEIQLNGERVDGMPPHRINRMGLSRSFQITSIFHRLSVFENLRCALLWSMGYRYS